MAFRIITWLLFIWGVICVLVMAFGIFLVAMNWNQCQHEHDCFIPFAYGLIGGWPAWLGLPLLSLVYGDDWNPTFKRVLFFPVKVAIIGFVLVGLITVFGRFF